MYLFFKCNSTNCETTQRSGVVDLLRILISLVFDSNLRIQNDTTLGNILVITDKNRIKNEIP